MKQIKLSQDTVDAVVKLVELVQGNCSDVKIVQYSSSHRKHILVE